MIATFPERSNIGLPLPGVTLVSVADAAALWSHVTVLQFDDETSRRLELAYSRPFVVERRRRARAPLYLRRGETVLDVGCGPGFTTAEIAEEVGPGGRVVGVDTSESMLALARRRCPGSDFKMADATKLPAADGSFDAALAAQVYEYVPDVAAALADLHRVLRPGGRAVVVDTDWSSVSWHSSEPERMQRVLALWAGHLADPVLPRTLRSKSRKVGFEVAEPEVMHVTNFTYGADVYAGFVGPLIRDYVAGRGGVTAREAEEWEQDLKSLSERGDHFLAFTMYIFLITKTGGTQLHP
jgi:arsenite methyltransferase